MFAVASLFCNISGKLSILGLWPSFLKSPFVGWHTISVHFNQALIINSDDFISITYQDAVDNALNLKIWLVLNVLWK